MTEEIRMTTGRVDVVIANAGRSIHLGSLLMTDISFSALLDHYGPSSSCTPAQMMKHYEVNAVGILVLFQAIWPLLQKSKNPKFIPISSASGSVSEGPGYRIPTLAYSASKAAVNFIARTIRMEHEALGNITPISEKNIPC
jgi:NAD(P)-dependent dehydrogenase (short-subunit alcohol dehydrogenase family)